MSKEQILELVELIHHGKRVSFWWTMGVNQGYEAVRTAQAIINLALMTGNIGKPGTGGKLDYRTVQCDGIPFFQQYLCIFRRRGFYKSSRRKRISEVLGVTG